MRTAAFLNRMPPYLFAQIDAKRDALEAQGVDVISLGIGDPDTPTPPHIVDAMAEAIRNPANHRYPDYAGSRAYRTACADWMRSRFGVEVDPATEVLALIGSKEGIAHLHTAYLDPGDWVLAPSIGYPVYSGGALMQNANTYFMPMREEDGFLADFSKVPAVPGLPQQPHRRLRRRSVLRRRHRVLPRARPAARARQRLLRHLLRRLPRALHPGAAACQGVLHRVLQPVEVLQHDRLAHRLRLRQP